MSARAAGRLVLALALLGPAAAHAEALEQLHRFLTQTHSAQGDFTQTSPGPRAPAGRPAATTTARGHFEFLRPGRFRWAVQSPYEQLVVGDGENLYLYDKDLNQVTRRRLAGGLPASPAAILFGSNDFERDFLVQADGVEAGEGGIEWVRATPKARDSAFETIRIGLRADLPVAMELRDSFGQSTTLRFDHVQRNPPLAAARFAFTPPPGADVLEDR